MKIKLVILFFLMSFSSLLQAEDLIFPEKEIFKLIKENNLERFTELIEKGVSPDLKNEKGTSLLHLSVEYENKAFFDFLIEKGADLDIKGYQEDRPIHWAALADNSYFLIELIEKGADLNAKNEHGKTALHFAIFSGDEKPVHMEILIKNKVDLNAQDNKGRTPLHYVIVDGDNVRLRLLIKNKADINLKDHLGASPLHEASRLKKRLNMVKILVKSGAAVNDRDKGQNTPLMEAVKSNNTLAAQFLLKYGADVFVVDRFGRNIFKLIPHTADEKLIRQIQAEHIRRNKINKSKRPPKSAKTKVSKAFRK